MYWMYGIRNYYRDLSSIMGFNPGFRLKAHFTSIYGTVSPLLVGVSEGNSPIISVGATLNFSHLSENNRV